METLHNIISQEIIQRIGWTLVHFVWQGFAVALILAIVLKLLHKSSANLRYIIACIALALMVVLPMVTFRIVKVAMVRPTLQVSENPKSEILNPKQIQISKSQIQTEGTSIPINADMQNNKAILQLLASMIEPILPYAVTGWLVGVFGLSLWHLGGWRQLQRLRRQMVRQVTPALKAKLQRLSNMLGIQKTIGLVESAMVQVPTVVGHLKPIILLPASALTGLSTEQIEAILAHELAHIKRCDYLVNMLQTVVEILGFYHPAVWWVSHKIRVERENCCDDIAVSICSDRICYAKALATMEEIRSHPSTALRTGPALAVAASGGSLFDRIRRLLGKDSTNEGKLSWLVPVLTISLIVLVLVLVSCQSSRTYQPTSTWNSKIEQLDIDKANRSAVIKVFGEPIKYIWGQQVFDKKALPDRYIMVYPGDFHICILNDHIVELRFEGPSDYVFRDSLVVGSSVDKALSVLGQPTETVVGKANEFKDNVLYRDIEGKKGWGYYARPDKNIRIWILDDKVKAIYLTRSDYSAGGGIELKEAELPETSHIDEYGHIVDKIDYPFINDTNAIGGWESVDFVKDIEDFKPGKKYWHGDLFVKELFFLEGGKTNWAFRWTEDLLLHEGDKTASKYSIKEIDGSKYMFMEWKSGDYTIRHRKPCYYVLKQNKDAVYVESRTMDKIDYPFVDDPCVLGKWESVDFVDVIDQFKTDQKQWKGGGLFLIEMMFDENGKVTLKNNKVPKGYGRIWTKGLVLDEKEKTASKYTIKEIDDSIYMFYEWKSGDYTIRHMKPKYYVLKKIGTEAEKSAGQGEKSAEFGDVIEEVLPAIEGRSQKLLDVDTSRWGTKADFGENDRETHKWVRDNGLDLLGVFEKEQFGLLAFDMAILPAKSNDWERLEAKDVIENKQLNQIEANKITPMMPKEAPDKPATYLFRTRENGIGILQIVDFTDNPKGVKIRYKIVQGTGSENLAVQVEKLLEGDPTIIILDQQLAEQKLSRINQATEFGKNSREVRQTQELINEIRERREARKSQITEQTKIANLKSQHMAKEKPAGQGEGEVNEAQRQIEAASQREQELQKRSESLQKLKRLGLMFDMYANDHVDKYPNNLEEIKPYDNNEILPWALENVKYLGQGKKITIDPQAIIAYDRKMLLEKDETNVLFNDSHVEFCNTKRLKDIGIDAGIERRLESAQKLMNLGMAMLVYANDQKGDYPAKLEDLKKADLTKQEIDWYIKNIEYWGNKATAISRPDTVLAYDKTLLKQENSQGANVLYNDSHVSFEKTESLEKLGITTGEKLAPQILTTGYILSVPADLPQLKEILPSKDKPDSGTPMITPEKLEEFLNITKTVPGARVIAAPKLLTNDGEVGEIRTKNAKDFNSIKLNIKNTVGADRKTVRLELDFEYSVSAGQDVTSTSASTTATVLSNHAIAVTGSIPLNGQTVLLIVKPQVLEAGQFSKTVVVAADAMEGEILRIPDINFEPIRQGKNVVWITVENKSDKSEFFGVNVYSRSVDYGPQGVGWGTTFYEKLDAGQTKKLRYVYKIQGPVTKNTYTRLWFYNAKSLEHKDNKDLQPFAERQYSINDLKLYPSNKVQVAMASQEQFEAISQAFIEIQQYIRNGDYQSAWNLFSDDYQKAEYQARGFEGFKLQMEPKHPLNSAFLWEKQDFLKLKPVNAYMDDGRIALGASIDNSQWTINFVQQNGQWKMDWIAGYRPKILDMQEADNK